MLERAIDRHTAEVESFTIQLQSAQRSAKEKETIAQVRYLCVPTHRYCVDCTYEILHLESSLSPYAFSFLFSRSTHHSRTKWSWIWRSGRWTSWRKRSIRCSRMKRTRRLLASFLRYSCTASAWTRYHVACSNVTSMVSNTTVHYV